MTVNELTVIVCTGAQCESGHNRARNGNLSQRKRRNRVTTCQARVRSGRHASGRPSTSSADRTSDHPCKHRDSCVASEQRLVQLLAANGSMEGVLKMLGGGLPVDDVCLLPDVAHRGSSAFQVS